MGVSAKKRKNLKHLTMVVSVNPKKIKKTVNHNLCFRPNLWITVDLASQKLSRNLQKEPSPTSLCHRHRKSLSMLICSLKLNCLRSSVALSKMRDYILWQRHQLVQEPHTFNISVAQFSKRMLSSITLPPLSHLFSISLVVNVTLWSLCLKKFI